MGERNFSWGHDLVFLDWNFVKLAKFASRNEWNCFTYTFGLLQVISPMHIPMLSCQRQYKDLSEKLSTASTSAWIEGGIMGCSYFIIPSQFWKFYSIIPTSPRQGIIPFFHIDNFREAYPVISVQPEAQRPSESLISIEVYRWLVKKMIRKDWILKWSGIRNPEVYGETIQTRLRADPAVLHCHSQQSQNK